ncbi:MAG: PAS domain-containing sensor histidine kinase [Gammaproteobacteria bacterium]|nr:PAS domain-containing sensor histidine kinase [Gammaproteobacteria bacterium]MBK80291.1 PAS domain-containing sensor histidine kinase [Gammaproteobacteria bacterium]|tara:strand:+ start:2241 stop:3866 length:1626 start_codon:yes stop_codon:yes gene_type:complete
MLAHRAEILDEIERRRYALNLSLLKIYSYYRLLVGLGLAVVFQQNVMGSAIGQLDPVAFLRLTLLYSLLNVVSVIFLQVVPRRHFHTQLFATALGIYDIVVLTALMYFSGGLGSGIGLLVLVSVATGAILVTGRRALLLASLAAIGMLYQELYLSLTAPQYPYDYFQAGVLGALCFGAALALQYLSQRVRDNDIRALTQAAELSDLEQVNRQIIQRMRTGIVVVDAANHVRMANQSARALLGVPGQDDLARLPAVLERHLEAWRQDTERRAAPFHAAPGTPEIRANFSAVRSDDPSADVTIFLEDTSEVQQQAQQLKLAALGRLSASIAHEIRNPLGAISHAAQLLHESQVLETGDRRLTEIIRDHCKRMNGVVENVLETSRRRPPSPVRLPLGSHLAEFVTAFRDASADAQICVNVDPYDTEVRIDKGHLDQVLTNLVSNAVRHSREHTGRPIVHLRGGIDSRTERPFLTVIDEGPGVSEDMEKHLFEPFFTTARSGTGLGLYISRELCEANQARLTYERADGGGACFRITFSHPDRIIA